VSDIDPMANLLRIVASLDEVLAESSPSRRARRKLVWFASHFDVLGEIGQKRPDHHLATPEHPWGFTREQVARIRATIRAAAEADMAGDSLTDTPSPATPLTDRSTR